MYRNHFLYNPCCYHRSCWEAVGKPRGYRAPSLVSEFQGSGCASYVFGLDEDENEDPGTRVPEPSPGPEAMHLWAVNSVCYFIYQMGAWARAEAHAQKEREMWELIDKIEELAKP
jgi:hypothetical protein